MLGESLALHVKQSGDVFSDGGWSTKLYVS